MKVNANSLRIGNIIDYQNQLWKILKRDHVKPGKGGAYVQIEMKNIITGTKTNNRYNSSEDIDVAYVEQKTFQYQYMDQDELSCMDMESFEQFNFNKDLIEETTFPFLQDGMDIVVEYCNDKPISIQLPETVTLNIDQADAVVKGQTATSSYKPAVLENGVKTMVPQFVASGDRIVVRTQDATYVERAKD